MQQQQQQQEEPQHDPPPKRSACNAGPSGTSSSSSLSTTATTSSTLSSSGGASRAPAAAAAAAAAAPYFYHTCPQYQPKDLDKERNEKLSPEEREEADADLQGTSAILRETPELVQASLQEFHDALESIPLHEKHSYLRAIEATSMEFVTSESPPPLAFLRCELFDAHKAARRFVAYWSTRHKIFGDDRAFRSMCACSNNQKESKCCGEQQGTEAVEGHVYDDKNDGRCDPDPDDVDDTGCMSDVDWEALERGTAKELPHDDRGRAVVVFKANCVPMELADTQPVLARALFYTLHVAAQDDTAQRHGFVFLYHATSAPLTPQLRKRAKLCLHVVENCAPVRLRACHGMYPPQSRSLATLVRPAMLGIMSRNARQRSVQHVGSARQHAVELQLYGLRSAGIPIEFGGSYMS